MCVGFKPRESVKVLVAHGPRPRTTFSGEIDHARWQAHAFTSRQWLVAILVCVDTAAQRWVLRAHRVDALLPHEFSR